MGGGGDEGEGGAGVGWGLQPAYLRALVTVAHVHRRVASLGLGGQRE